MRRRALWTITLVATSLVALTPLSACGGGEGRPRVLEEVFAGTSSEDASAEGGPTDGAARDGD